MYIYPIPGNIRKRRIKDEHRADKGNPQRIRKMEKRVSPDVVAVILKRWPFSDVVFGRSCVTKSLGRRLPAVIACRWVAFSEVVSGVRG